MVVTLAGLDFHLVSDHTAGIADQVRRSTRGRLPKRRWNAPGWGTEVSGPKLDILGLGTIAVDDTLYVERYPPPDQKARIRREGRSPGGQIATALAAARRLGAKCAYGAVLGDDPLSIAARNALETAGIDCRFVRQEAGAGPIHSVIVLDEDAGTRNLFFDISRVVPWPAAEISQAMIASAKVLLTDQLGPDTVIRAATSARELGRPVVMDMEWADVPRLDEMIALADHLLVPREFGSAYTGLGGPREIVSELDRRCRRACTAVTCGKDGCYYVLGAARTREVQYLPAPEVKTVETTGCGDVFHGAYAAALAAGKDLAACLRFASAAAGCFAARPSGWQYLPSASEVEPLLATMD